MRRAVIPTMLAIAVFAGAARGEPVIGVVEWTAPPEAQPSADGLDPTKLAQSSAAFVESEIFRLLNEAPKFKSCKARMTEMVRREELEKEQKLQLGPYGDKNTAIKPGQMLEPTHLIKGAIGSSANGHSYTVEIVDAKSGKTAESYTAPVGDGDIEAALEALAADIVRKLCPLPAMQVKASYNDLVIDQKVCDLSKPFILRGTGQTAGIQFKMQPADADGGSFSLGGTAGGVPWSGGGTYAVALAEGGGTINISGAWKITTPVGTFGDSGTIPGTLTALDKPCEE
ncbi:MAG: hypothetical protein LCH99_27250 [Proteobacteria bacterium]|nr:hypothetical protein [Pseudomonadota bacterium]